MAQRFLSKGEGEGILDYIAPHNKIELRGPFNKWSPHAQWKFLMRIS